MKTKAMAHQLEGLNRLEGKAHYGLGAEQGTGKTWMLLADTERLFASQHITGALVIAPNGVHTNWTRREIPTHLEVPVNAQDWKSGAGVHKKRALATLLKKPDPSVLSVLSMNIDAVNTKSGKDFAEAFMRTHRGEVTLIVDESTRVKNLQAQRTKNVLQLAKIAAVRRIASGTMVANSPLDLFGQFEVMAPGAGLLGTRSYRAFVAEFAELIPPGADLVKDILSRSNRKAALDALARLRSGEKLRPQDEYQIPQLVKKNLDGTPRWKNLEKLRELMAPYIYRVLKKDCLDLPDKIFQSRYFELTPAQRRDYTQVTERMRWERDNGQIDRFTALTLTTKLRQIASGFIALDGIANRLVTGPENPKLRVLREVVEDVSGQFIIWCSFVEEIAEVGEVLRDLGVSYVEYYGETSKADREVAIDTLQSREVRCFLATAQAGGIGLTLTAASTVIYYNRTYSLEDRLQSEDRAHRIGTEKDVVYIDLVAMDTIDERVVNALQSKQEVADRILNYI